LTLADGRLMTLFGSASKSIESSSRHQHQGRAYRNASIFHQYYPGPTSLPSGKLFTQATCADNASTGTRQ
jgi:hypothetical protein